MEEQKISNTETGKGTLVEDLEFVATSVSSTAVLADPATNETTEQTSTVNLGHTLIDEPQLRVALLNATTEIERLKEEIESHANYRKKYTCGVCWNRPRNIVFLPCGHIICCDVCFETIKTYKSICPTCKAHIKDGKLCYFS